RCITDRIESLYSSTGKLGGRSNGQSKILGDEEMETLKTFSKMLRFLDDDTQSDFTLQNTGEIEGAVKDETEKGYFLKLKDNFHESVHNETVEKGKIVKYLKNSFFKPCITKKMMRVKCRAFLNCKEIKGKKIPTKKCKASQRPIISTEYYEPCTHEGATCSKKKCDCTSRGVACEISCACISCNNMRFCSCAECGDDCPCYTFNRECSDLCGCAKKTVEVFGMKRQEVLPKSTCTFIEKQRISLLKLNTFQEMKALACKNRNIQRRTAYKLSVCESKRHGYGLFSSGFIKKGSFVIEYTGEIISDKESERRGNFYEINKCSYLFNLVNRNGESLYSIDAYYGGNASRYINHSKNGANLKSEVILCEGRPHIMFYSLRDIYGGEELLFDYHFTEAHKKEHGIID
ncbi:[histone H3]-lysine27 N-trimethyltransferase EZH2, partial [Pancytospora epiphaga]